MRAALRVDDEERVAHVAGLVVGRARDEGDVGPRRAPERLERPGGGLPPTARRRLAVRAAARGGNETDGDDDCRGRSHGASLAAGDRV